MKSLVFKNLNGLFKSIALNRSISIFIIIKRKEVKNKQASFISRKEEGRPATTPFHPLWKATGSPLP